MNRHQYILDINFTHHEVMKIEIILEECIHTIDNKTNVIELDLIYFISIIHTNVDNANY